MTVSAPAPFEIVSWDGVDRALRVVVDGYQYPGNKSQQYDNEWLMISGSVRCDGGEWTFRDPCLTSSELPYVASLLEKGVGPTDPDWEPIVEPCLHFSWIDPGRMRVAFRLECAPPWKVDEPVEGAPSGWGYPLVFDVSAELASATAKALREAAARFPPQ